MKRLLILLAFTAVVSADSTYYEKGELVELQKMNVSRSIDTDSKEKNIEFFKTRSGEKIGITDAILVQCKVGVNCKALLTQFNLSNVSKLSNSIFILKIDNSDNIFSLSRELYETGKVEFAHPNFVKERRLR